MQAQPRGPSRRITRLLRAPISSHVPEASDCHKALDIWISRAHMQGKTPAASRWTGVGKSTYLRVGSVGAGYRGDRQTGLAAGVGERAPERDVVPCSAAGPNWPFCMFAMFAALYALRAFRMFGEFG